MTEPTSTPPVVIPTIPVNTFDQAKHLADDMRLFVQPGQIVELRAPKTKRKFGRPVCVSGFYDFDHLDNFARDALTLTRRGLETGTGFASPGVYFTLNPLNPDLLARRANRYDVAEDGQQAKDTDVIKRAWMLVDVDPIRLAEVSSTDDEKAQAKAVLKAVCTYLQSRGFPDPVLADSGNGYHAYYRIDLPANDEGVLKAVLHSLAARFDTESAKVDTTVFNPSRICKVPGTTSRKGDSIPNRPHRTAQILFRPDGGAQLVPIELLRAIADEWIGNEANRKAADKPKSTEIPAQVYGGSGSHNATDRDEVLKQASKYMAKVPGAVAGQSGHNDTFRAALKLVKGFSLSVDDAFPIFAEWNQGCNPPWDEHDLRRKLEEADKADGERGFLIREPKPQGSKAGTRSKASASTATFQKGEELPEDSLLLPENQTDLALAARYGVMFGEQLKYVPEWDRFIRWTGCRWHIDITGQEVELYRQLSKYVWEQCEITKPEKKDGEEQKESPLLGLAKKVASASTVRNVIGLAKSRPDIASSVDVWDRHQSFFNTFAGTINLRTGELRPHSRDDCLTKLCSTKYDPDAVCPLWEQTIFQILGGNIDLCHFLQTWFGYCMTGSTVEQKFPIFWGGGGNGKSLLVDTLLSVIGEDYGHKAPQDFLMENRADQHPVSLADLFGRRLVVCSETPEGARLNEALIKSLTGEKYLNARRLYENPWQFEVTHKLILQTNHKPKIRGTDDGVWRRVLLVPFNVKFWDPDKGETGPPELMRDNTLEKRLAEEASGILNWLVAGARNWYANGLQIPGEAIAATSAYKRESNDVLEFIDECCVIDERCRVQAKPLYEAYERWMLSNRRPPRSGTSFGTIMGKLTDDPQTPFKRGKSNLRVYEGLGLVYEHSSNSGDDEEEGSSRYKQRGMFD